MTATHPFVTRVEWEPEHHTQHLRGIDEIVTGPVDSVHIERMATGTYWMAIYKGEHRQVVWFNIEKCTMVARTEADY